MSESVSQYIIFYIPTLFPTIAKWDLDLAVTNEAILTQSPIYGFLTGFYYLKYPQVFLAM